MINFRKFKKPKFLTMKKSFLALQAAFVLFCSAVSAQVHPKEAYADIKAWNKVLDAKHKSYDPNNLKEITVSEVIDKNGADLNIEFIIHAPFEDVSNYYYQYQTMSFIHKGYIMTVRKPGSTDFYGSGSFRTNTLSGFSYSEIVDENSANGNKYHVESPMVETQKGSYQVMDLGNGSTKVKFSMQLKFKAPFTGFKAMYKFINAANIESMYTTKSLLEEDSKFYTRITWLDELIKKKGWPTPPPMK
ncbi:MAG: hypothetical protein C4K58_08270 [Flavobacteriaceae bacterium]|nr:MAG: hypothetical protein C4K58_08270 [Flavobacteriaceae bacterium]